MDGFMFLVTIKCHTLNLEKIHDILELLQNATLTCS